MRRPLIGHGFVELHAVLEGEVADRANPLAAGHHAIDDNGQVLGQVAKAADFCPHGFDRGVHLDPRVNVEVFRVCRAGAQHQGDGRRADQAAHRPPQVRSIHVQLSSSLPSD